MNAKSSQTACRKIFKLPKNHTTRNKTTELGDSHLDEFGRVENRHFGGGCSELLQNCGGERFLVTQQSVLLTDRWKSNNSARLRTDRTHARWDKNCFSLICLLDQVQWRSSENQKCTFYVFFNDGFRLVREGGRQLSQAQEALLVEHRRLFARGQVAERAVSAHEVVCKNRDA